MRHQVPELRASARLARCSVAAAVIGASVASCGPSIRAVYEGDVRFEHCMALDSYTDVKPTLRRGCWEEWLKFYTFGQTRDRIDYARVRRGQLVGASDFEESDPQPQKPSGPSAAVPEPTSVLAPPPMMLVTDGGADEDAAGSAADAGGSAAVSSPPGADCTVDCEQSWTFCRKECKTGPCEKACTTKYKRCMKRCF